MSARREVQRKAEIGEDACDLDYSTETEPTKSDKKSECLSSNAQDNLQKKILEILNKKPLMQQIAKKNETKLKPMTQNEKDDLKIKLLQDDKIKQAMTALRNSKKNMK